MWGRDAAGYVDGLADGKSFVLTRLQSESPAGQSKSSPGGSSNSSSQASENPGAITLTEYPSDPMWQNEIPDAIYDVSCNHPEVKELRVHLLIDKAGLVDKYGNPADQDVDLDGTHSLPTQKQASMPQLVSGWSQPTSGKR